MKKWIGILILAGIVLSCNHYAKNPAYVPEPTTLEELFRGFNEAELTPDIYKLEKEPIVIVATGHLYPLLKFPEVYDALIDKILEQKPDYFFSLGDLVRDNTMEEWKIVNNNYSKLNTKIYFSPGNHDLNYHYERYVGKRDNQVEAELLYLEQVSYRYKVVQDDFSNYVFINANDSAHRILNYIREMKPTLDDNKHFILLSSQSLWFKKHQDANNPRTWVSKPFKREELLPFIEEFEYLIHGDWGGKFYRGQQEKSSGNFDVMAVGNRKLGDPLFIARIEIYKDSISAKSIAVKIPDGSDWFK